MVVGHLSCLQHINRPLCVEALLQYDEIDVTMKDADGETALDLAISQNRQKCIDILTEYMKEHNLFTLFHVVRYNDFEYVKTFIIIEKSFREKSWRTRLWTNF